MSYETWAFKRKAGRLNPNRLSRDRWLQRHGQLCREALDLGVDGVTIIAQSLFRRATDDRALICAALEVRRTSGRSLGPRDEAPLADLSLSEICADCRFLRDELRSGEYTPGPTKSVPIAKYPSGTRTIQVADFADRIVAKAAQLILDPLLDPTLLPSSFGFRPGLSRFHAMARLKQYLENGYSVAAAVDIRKAFDQVPHTALLEILRKRLGLDDIVEHIRNLVQLDTGKGVPQGNALSPLLLNIYADHRVDRPWTDKHPDWPMIRYADDIVVLTRNYEEGLEALRRLERLTTSACLPLKDTSPGVISNLADGQGMDWLGHHLELNGCELAVGLRSDEAARLTFKLQHQRNGEEKDQEARRRILAWARSRGPAYGTQTVSEFIGVVTQAMDAANISLYIAEHQLIRHWELGHEHWQEVLACSTPAVDIAALTAAT